MFRSKMFDITMQQAYIFLKAAEYENFSKVAVELHMTQPTVSRNINALEMALGLILFVRAKQRVRLTPAGSILYSEWVKSMDKMESAYEKAFSVQGGQINQLSIVDNNSTRASSYLLPIISRFESKNPNVHLNIERTNILDAIGGMLAGKYDMGFFINVDRPFFDETQMGCIELFSSNPVVLIPEVHPLFTKEIITKEDLRDATYIVPKNIGDNYWKKLITICNEYDFQPYNRIEVPNPQTVILELAKGSGIAIMDNEFKLENEVPCRKIELSDCPIKFGFILTYPKKTDNKNIAAFIKAATDFSKEIKLENAEKVSRS